MQQRRSRRLYDQRNVLHAAGPYSLHLQRVIVAPLSYRIAVATKANHPTTVPTFSSTETLLKRKKYTPIALKCH